MTNTAWHAPSTMLVRYASDPVGIDHAQASSLEAHLIACAECRAALDEVVTESIAASSWSAIARVVDQPNIRFAERLLRGVGVSDGRARVLAATPGLTASWLVGVVVIIAGVVLASRDTEAAGVFLVLAPLLPLAAVATAFAPVLDPAGEAGVATPMNGLTLVLQRSVIVLGSVFVALVLGDLALGDLGAPIAAWVLPSLALSAGALALGTWLRTEVAFAWLASGWVALIFSYKWTAGRGVAIADSAVFDAIGQSIALAVIVAACAVVWFRRDRFQTMEVF